MFFGYYFACGLVIIVAGLLGAISGYVTFVLGKRKIKSSIAVGVVAALLFLLGIFGYYVVYSPNDFYGYAGDFDYYRMPLDYPYELSMIDMIDCANIKKWHEDELLMMGITHYYKLDNIIIGKLSEACFFSNKSEWFSFDTKTGRSVKYKTEKEFRQALEELNFDDEPELLTIQENWDSYWGSY